MQRRDLLKLAVTTSALLVQAACAPATPTSAPTAAPKPTTLPPPTQPIAPTTAVQSAAQQAPAALSPAVAVRVTTLSLAPEAALFIAFDKGYFKSEGLDLELVPSNTGEQLPALATGQAGFGNTPASPATFNAIAQGISIKYVAPYVVVPPDDAASGFVLAKSLIDTGKYQDYKDLKGTTIGAVNWDGSNRLYVEMVLARGGLTYDDITPQQLVFPDMVAALANNKIDGAWMVEPFITIAEGRGVGKRLVNDGELIPGDQPAVLSMSGAFEQSQPEAAKRFVAAWLHGQRDAWHAFDKKDVPPDEAISVLLKHTSIKDPNAYLGAMKGHALEGYEPNGTLNVKLLSDWQDYFLKIGAQKSRFDINKVVDASYAEYALQRLGGRIS